MNQDGDPLELQQWMEAEYIRGKWKYVELRPISWDMDSDSSLVATESFWVHTLDLTPSIDKIFRNLHKSCFQRRIRHADHEHLTYERSSTTQLVDDFYNLLLITRRRHALLPQPREWFQNIMAELSPNAEIRIARKDGVAIAAILTLRHRGTVVYKYGCTDGRFHRLAGMPFLLWKMIEEGKQEGFEQIDLGRTELANHGLIEFKDRMGTTRTKMSNLRYPKSEKTSGVQLSRMGGERKLLTFLPGVVSSTMGRLVYKHIA
jgi:lipid II:glycine glycyltransferase (peptidoglycan interpeptide bridge formation enzyme)